MTLVNFDLRAIAATGRVPADSRIVWRPVERRTDGGIVILPEARGIKLVDGLASADLDPGYYWFTETNQDGARAVRLVPSVGPVAYADLVEVDPETLEPSAVPDPAWLAMAASTVDSGEIQGDDLVLRRTDGSTVNAGNVRGPVGPPPALSIGQVTTGAAGSAASASLTGTADAPVLSMAIPQGTKGDPGGITLGTSIDTQDLDTLKTPGVYRRAATGTNLLALHYPADIDSGVLIVHVRLDPNTIYQEFHTWNRLSGGSRGYYIRTCNGGVWSAWNFVTTQRVDQAAGRAIYTWDHVNDREQLVYGDTGWRRVVAVGDIATMPNLAAYVRRVGQQVTYTILETTAGGTANGATTIHDIPAGFRANTGQSNPAMIFSAPAVDEGVVPIAAAILYAITAGANTLVLKAVAAKRHYATLSYSTNDAWPVTLPGVAIGSIPNL